MANPSLQIGNSNWAIKKDNLLGYSTAGTRFVPQPITMTRASAGTRVNPQGLVETVELLGSELVTNGDFESGTSGWSGYYSGTLNNTGNALNVVDNGGGARAGTAITTVIGKTYKYVADITQIQSTNTLLAVSNAINLDGAYVNGANITIPTNGLSVTFTATATTTYIGFKRNGAGVGQTNIYDNVSVKEYAINNLARVNYTGSTSSLLAEPQRTNLETTSASGSYGNPPASEILAIAPDGLNTAIRPVPDSNSDRYQNTLTGGTYSSGDEVTYSWYRKRFSTPIVDSFTGDLDVKSLVNSTQVGVTTEIASSINGYDRFSTTLSITDGSLTSTLRFYFGGVIGAGNSSVAYWGHQLEQGSYATSYIPTSGSTVTRVQDQYSKTGISDKINSTEGVLFVEMAALSDDGSERYIVLSDGTWNNRIQISFISSNRITTRVNVSGSTQYNATDTVSDITEYTRIALSWKEDDFKTYFNGVEVSSYGSGIVPNSNVLNGIYFGGDDGSVNRFFGKVKQLQVFKTALTDSELATLTTI